MHLTLTFYKTPKKRNSTKLACSKTDGRPYVSVKVCVLERVPSIINPVLRLPARPATSGDGITIITAGNKGVNIDIFKQTHVSIDEFGGRHYFIKDVSCGSNCIDLALELDVLSTYRGNILGAGQFVSRAESAYNGAIVDTLTPTTAERETNFTTTASDVYVRGANSGFYILGVVNGTADFGGTCYYAYSGISQLDNLVDFLLSDPNWMNIEDIGEALVKGLVNPLQYITSCKYFPLPIAQLLNEDQDAGQADVKLGFWQTDKWGLKPKKYTATFSAVMNIPKHPQAGEVGEFLNLSPYSRYVLAFEPFGTIPIDTTAIAGADRLELTLDVDIITGEAALTIKAISVVYNFVSKHYATIGVDVPLSQNSTNMLSAAAGAVGVVGGIVGAVAGGSAALGLSPIANGIVQTVESALPQMYSKGGTASAAFMEGNNPRLYAHFQKVQPIPAEIFGRPLCEFVTLGELSGYVECNRPVVENCGTAQECDAVVEMLRGGVYIE